jgi:hypothetical protein
LFLVAGFCIPHFKNQQPEFIPLYFPPPFSFFAIVISANLPIWPDEPSAWLLR